MNTYLKYGLCLGLIWAISWGGHTVTARDTDPQKKDKYEHAVLELELLKDYYELGSPQCSEFTYQFYDENDNLVYTSSLNDEVIPDPKLASYLYHSNLLIEYAGVRYFRVN